jgi:hypothetical protein
VAAVLGCPLLAFSAGIELLPDTITVRTSSDKSDNTVHYGNMEIYGKDSTKTLYVKNDNTNAVDRYAVWAECEPQAGYGVGGYAVGGRAGVRAYAIMADGDTTYHAGRFEGADGSINFGVYAKASGGTDYAVYGDGYNGDYAGYFDGNVTVTGTFTESSDARFKKNIVPLSGCLAKALQLRPVEFYYDTERYPEMGLPAGKRLGFVAQEAETVVPELVTTAHGEIDYKAMKPTQLIPLLIGAVQERQKEIDDLKKTVSTLGLQ